LLADPTLVEKASKRFWIECRETRAQFDEVNRLHNRILFFNNPILLLIVLTELLVFLAPAILLHGIFRGALSVRINSDVALNLVEEKSIKIAGAVPRLNFAH
ncbi:MAG TPA: hypothetical protein VMO78_15075, partial [Rhizomicrobium sp.]|nr:hypothetical protein [Rhizomicrobium sp.]